MLADNERDMNLDMRDDEITCAACGGSNLSRRMEMDEFEYGAGESAVSLSARVVVLTCNDSDIEFTGPSAEVARHEAVCRHLDINNHAAGCSFDCPVGGGLASSEPYVRQSLVLALLRGQSSPALKKAHGGGSRRARFCVFGSARFHHDLTEKFACRGDPGRARAAQFGRAAGGVTIRLRRGMAHPGRARTRRTGDAVPSVFS